ncbi:MAG: Uma2 family endonuclease [Coleofasciculaceae cyanobacterium SM2_1_6]|nr:Uma2 family endonuclease [Coleofasciculaceae cyanobacterium SM2_1_6]
MLNPCPEILLPIIAQKKHPTMYDLPSEYVGDAGMPDEFHPVQSFFLSTTFQTPRYSAEEIFTATDINLYYTLDHPLWYKRPDWMGVVGVSRFYGGVDLRASYVTWDEGVNPFIIVELLSLGTEKEDLGETTRSPVNEQTPPRKWQVYEQILKIPYYVVFSKSEESLRAFRLVEGSYREIELPDARLWIPELEIGLGLWDGEHYGLRRLWLRWYDAEGNWLPTDAEREQRKTELERQRAELERQRAEQESQRAEQESQRAEQESQRAEQAERKLEILREQLRAIGLSPEDFSS